jgi:hypothetical protein
VGSQAESADVANGLPTRESSAPVLSAPVLSDRDAGILEFERQWWKHAGAKEEAIREKFGLSAARYYQILNAVLDLPAALVSDPMLVQRLRRLRDSRIAARSARVVAAASHRDSSDRSSTGRPHEPNN